MGGVCFGIPGKGCQEGSEEYVPLRFGMKLSRLFGSRQSSLAFTSARCDRPLHIVLRQVCM